MVLPILISCQEINKKTSKTEFEVNGNCIMCKKRIEKAALSVKGVKKVNWSIPTHMLSIFYDPRKINIENIHKAISEVGHDTSLTKAIDIVYNDLPICCLYERKKIVKNE
jgi:copper chaperone CopZ